MVFPPQVTMGEQAVAQLESTPMTGIGAKSRPDSRWHLECDGSPMGSADSRQEGISFQVEHAGSKRLVAKSDHTGAGVIAIAQADLVVHREVGQEIDAIVNQVDLYNAFHWFRSISDRHPGDIEYRDKLDLILCSHFRSPREATRQTAFELACRLHEPAWRKAAASYLKRDEHSIDDVLQETRRRTWRSLGRLRPGERFGPWAYRSLINACRDAKRGALPTAGDAGHEVARADDSVGAVDAVDALGRLTRGWNRDDVEVLKLRFGQDMTYIEIAEALNIKPGCPDPTRVSAARRRVEKLAMDLERTLRSDGDSNEREGSL